MLRILFILLLFSTTLFSQINETNDEVRESWYTYWGLGWSNTDYAAPWKNTFDILESTPGIDRTRLSMDMLGFYFHAMPNTIVGVIINGTADRFEKDSDYLQYNQYLYSGSVIQYLSEEFGSGIFMRADVGLAKAVFQAKGQKDLASKSGFGVLLGGGFSFDLGGTRILLNANYALRKYENGNYKSLNLSIGGMF